MMNLDLSIETPSGGEFLFQHEVTKASVQEFVSFCQSMFESSQYLDVDEFLGLLSEDDRSDAERFLVEGYKGWAAGRLARL